MDIVRVYPKQRKEFGRYPEFENVDEDPIELSEIKPDLELQSRFVEKQQCTTQAQATPDISSHEINTDRIETVPKGMLHQEGGWPKDVDPSEIDHTTRHRKKIERSERFQKAVKDLGSVVEPYIEMNNAIDIYEEYFPKEDSPPLETQPPSAKTLTVFRDPVDIPRSVKSLSWSPTDGKKLAIAYCPTDFQGQKSPQQQNSHAMSSYVWDISNPNTPDMELVPPSPLCSLEFSKDAHLIVGGSLNGLVSYWDVRKGSHPVDSSLIERSHQDPVYDVKWLHSKSGTEFMSASTDGQVLTWDYRKLGAPIDSLKLQPKNTDAVHGAVSLNYNPQTTGISKFLTGTEEGSVLPCSRKGKTPADRVGVGFPGHHGPVYAVQRNTFFNKYFLTVGDWTAKIWIDDLHTPILSTAYHAAYLTDGGWSPSRASVFLATKMDGSLDVWDYLYKQNSPVLSVQVCDAPLHTLRIQNNDGRFLAVGAEDGTASLIRLSSGLCSANASEKTAFQHMLERETKREKNLDARSKEVKRKASAKHRNDEEDNEEEGGEEEEDMSKVTQEFMAELAVDENEPSETVPKGN